MVKSPVPDDQYRFDTTHYIASFILKTNTIPPGPPFSVVQLEAWCKNTDTLLASRVLNSNEFSGSLQTETLEFDLPLSSSMYIKPEGVLTGGVEFTSSQEGLAAASTDCSSIDIRVRWYGNTTVWLNKVIIQDNAGQELFSGTDDAAIYSSAQNFHTSYPLVKRFYFSDEPKISSFQAYNYVQNITRSAYGGDAINGVASGVTAQPYKNSFDRFLIDAHPHELVVDYFPVVSDVPNPNMTDAEAENVGIVQYNNNPSYYTQTLQAKFTGLINTLGTAAVSTKQHGIDLWYVPQLHGVYVQGSGGFRNRDGGPQPRPPTGNEIIAMCNLGVAYGAKGIVPYPFDSEKTYSWNNGADTAYWPGLVTEEPVGGLLKNHWTNYATYPSPTGNKSIRMGFKEKWDALASVMEYYSQISSTLSALSWQGTKSWDNFHTTGTWNSIVSNITTNVSGETTYVETGHFVNSGNDYLFVVNRRTLSSDQRNISVTINKTSYNNWKISEIGTSNTWTVSGTGTFTTSYQPGEGKLFKMEPVVIAGGNLVYNENIPAGTNISIRNTVTVNPGVTLTINSGASLQFASGNYRLDVNGILNATGTQANPITFDFTHPYIYGMNGIVFENSSSGSLSYCVIKNANTGVLRYPSSSLSSITYCTITNCYTGVNCTGLPVFDHNTVSNNNVGVTISNTGVSSEISSNTITQNSGTGLVLNNVLSRNGVSWNTITYNGGYGVSCLNGATPYMRLNSISHNGSDGLHCEGSSPAHFGSQYGDPGYNAVRSNGRYGVYANNSNVYMGKTAFHYGENSITDNSTCGVWATNYSDVYAQYNWWGHFPNLTSADYHQDGGSIVHHEYPIDFDPNSSRQAVFSVKQTASISETIPSESNTYDSTSDSELDDALDNMMKGDFLKAITLYTKKFQSEKDINKRRYILEQLATCYREVDSTITGRKAKEEEFIGFINKNVRPGLSQSSELYAKTLELENIILTDLGQYEKAAFVLQSLKDKFSDEDIQKNAAFNLAYLCYIPLNNPSKGKEYLDELSSKYPNDQMTSDAKIIFGIKNTNSLAKQTQGNNNLAELNVEKPVSYSLMQNYPNPFNPNTQIDYSIKEDGLVIIKVFDILGREVAILVNEEKPAGIYTINFNASHFPSGIYLYTIDSGDFHQAKKMLLIK
ncbi:MAG: right-handed parallel beta-helix repeat-containing protein [Ignavibacteriaceae bacterium]